MHWQEWIFLIGQMIFNISLLPSILGKDKPALLTSTITAAVLFIYVIIYGTLSLWVTAISMGTTGVFWAILAYQKYRNTRIKK